MCPAAISEPSPIRGVLPHRTSLPSWMLKVQVLPGVATQNTRRMVVQGELDVDKDFGSVYVAEVTVEDAEVTVE